MFQSVHIPLVFIVLLNLSCVSCVNQYVQLQPVADRDRLNHLRKRSANSKRENDLYNEAKLFEHIYETGSTQTVKPVTFGVNKDDNYKTLREIKIVLQQLLEKLNNMDNNKYSKGHVNLKIYSTPNPSSSTDYEEIKPLISLLSMKKRNELNHLRKPRWGQWTSWSACSVTCGKGREIRWRHCLEDCQTAETEMEEKACQLPACGPGKIFGIQFK